MLENDLKSRPERHPLVSLIIIIVMAGLGFVIIGPIIGMFAALPFYPGGLTEMVEALQSPAGHPELKLPFYIVQGFATFIGLILVPAYYMKKNGTSVGNFFTAYRFEWIPVIVTAFIVIIFMAVNSVFIEWNSNMSFPEFAKGLERWARSHEDAAAELTTLLTKFDSVFELLIAIIVIAVLPAIGEEIVFRGLIQNELYRWTKNIHVAVWTAAFLFSAIHLQFFGFLPRFLLGALFGYLYYWSGNLTIAIIAHFVNNGVSVVALYFYQQGALDIDPESTESVPANVVVISALLTIGLLYYFYKYFEHRKPAISNRDIFSQ